MPFADLETPGSVFFFLYLCCTLTFPLLIYSIRRLEAMGPLVDNLLLFQCHLISVQTHNYRDTYSMYTNIVCVQTQKDRHTHRHTHLHMHTKPPSGQGLTLTLKGLCLAPVIATPQAGYVVCISTSLPLCVYECVCYVCVCVKRQCMAWTLADTQGTQSWSSHGFVCACIVVCFCLNNYETTAVPPTMLREAEQLFLWRCLFVVLVGRQEMRSCWGLWLCVRRAYRRAGPGQEENTNHLLGGLAGLMEMRTISFCATYQSKVESMVTPGTAISLLLSIFSLLLSLTWPPPSPLPPNVTKYPCETAHTKVIANHLSQKNSPLPHTSDTFHLISLQVTVFGGFTEGAELNTALDCQKSPPFSFHTSLLLPSFLYPFIACGNWAASFSALP